MYTLKSIARRGTALGMAAAFVVATVMPAASVFAQVAGLNPLTERSLLLSSSAPGHVNTDGSGYSTANPNPAAVGNPDTPGTFAPAGSGPNGMKTGQTFTFRASSSSPIEAMTFQYCTTAAGNCQAPGNNTGDASETPSTRLANEDTGGDPDPVVPGGWSNSTSDLDITGVFAQAAAGTAPEAGQFQVSVGNSLSDLTPTATDDWSFAATNVENSTNAHTGKSNFVTISSADGTQINAGQYVQVKFVASEEIFITNPGAGHFFVKINTYSDEVASSIVDGGVTVANVMTDSIHITTKVLETMRFSVGIQNPDTVQQASPQTHGVCQPIDQTSTITGLTNNRLNLGNDDAEYSLETDTAHDVFSYWRLSSNSSGGAVVYYSGDTLSNTVGDQIRAMTAEDGTPSLPGTEQFGLGFVDVSTGDHADSFSESFLDAVEDEDMVHFMPSSYPFITVDGQAEIETPDFRDFSALAEQRIQDLPYVANPYINASGTLQDGTAAGSAHFKFLPTSLMVPEPIASQDETVISCATAKMRYVGNIGADTPAGVYTTKVNYLAAPQY